MTLGGRRLSRACGRTRGEHLHHGGLVFYVVEAMCSSAIHVRSWVLTLQLAQRAVRQPWYSDRSSVLRGTGRNSARYTGALQRRTARRRVSAADPARRPVRSAGGSGAAEPTSHGSRASSLPAPAGAPRHRGRQDDSGNPGCHHSDGPRVLHQRSSPRQLPAPQPRFPLQVLLLEGLGLGLQVRHRQTLGCAALALTREQDTRQARMRPGGIIPGSAASPVAAPGRAEAGEQVIDGPPGLC